MKKLFVFLGVALTAIGSALRAQEVDSMAPLQKSSWGDAKTSEVTDHIPEIAIDARFGYSQNITGKTGRFGGNGLFLDINGRISRNFTYSLNHRLANFEGQDSPGFGNTNWLTLTYEVGDFFITAGKEDLKIGNFEYDTYDLDSYGCMNSLFWNAISPWQWGISAGWYPAEGQLLSLQVANSPFSDIEIFNLFSYAAIWRGEWDCYESYWTCNLWQNSPHTYVKALNLGNRFHFGGFYFDLEYMARATDMKKFFTSDFTVTFAPSYEWNWGRVFARFGWEKVRQDMFDFDFTGSNLYYGAGVEFFPLKEYKDIRIHAVWSSDTNLGGAHMIEVGLKWRLDLTKAGRYLFNKLGK